MFSSKYVLSFGGSASFKMCFSSFYTFLHQDMKVETLKDHWASSLSRKQILSSFSFCLCVCKADVTHLHTPFILLVNLQYRPDGF